MYVLDRFELRDVVDEENESGPRVNTPSSITFKFVVH
jgi:hypothetical protein